MTDAIWRQQHAVVEQMIRAIMHCPVPIIAAVNGAAYAGGMELALACDFVYAAQSARFALTEVTLGIITGAPFTAQQVLAWGMVNRVCEDAELMREVLAVAARIAGNAPLSLPQAKNALDKAADLDRMTGYAFEIEAYNRTVVSEDRREGINAFNEKRKLHYKGT
jgi:enoyl-CoA hydratase